MSSETDKASKALDLMGEVASLCPELAVVAGVASIAKTIIDLIEPPPTMAAFEALLLAEIKNILITELASEDIRLAAAKLDSLRDFLSKGAYYSAIKNGENMQQLYQRLFLDNSSPDLSELNTTKNLLLQWVKELKISDSNLQKTKGIQSFSLLIGYYLYLILLYRERCRVYYIDGLTPQAIRAGRDTEWDTLRTLASEAAETLPLLLKDLIESRVAQVKSDTDRTLNSGIVDYFINWDYHFGNAIQNNVEVEKFLEVYKEILRGKLLDEDSFYKSYERLPKGIGGGSDLSKFRADTYDKVLEFGAWVRNAEKNINYLTSLMDTANPFTWGYQDGNLVVADNDLQAGIFLRIDGVYHHIPNPTFLTNAFITPPNYLAHVPTFDGLIKSTIDLQLPANIPNILIVLVAQLPDGYKSNPDALSSGGNILIPQYKYIETIYYLLVGGKKYACTRTDFINKDSAYKLIKNGSEELKNFNSMPNGGNLFQYKLYIE